MLAPMSALQLVAIVLSLVVSTIGWVMLFRTVYGYVRLFRVGAPDPTRTNQPGKRTVTLLREFLGHTRMARLPLVAIAHWITAVGFLVLFTTLITAFGQLFKADFALPLIGHFPPFEWLVEVLAWTMLVAIVYLMVLRQARHPRATKPPRRSRFYGSNWWQAYYVEFTILGVGLCILALRSLEAALAPFADPQMSVALHFPLTGWTAGLWSGLGEEGIRQAIYLFAFLKIMISFAWMITVSLTPTMGVAWHRFLAFFNIWFKRNADGRTALGPLRPMVVDGEPVTAANLEDVMEKMAEAEDEDAEVAMGVGKIDQFSWKGLLDFTTCTECGRCQSQCPAWNTDKPLSPKMLMITLRNHAYEQAPYLLATEAERAALPEHQRQLANVGLVGSTNYTLDHPLTAYDHLGPEAIIDEDVLWSCTTCGACVEQCPVDIEHVDAIVDMRRHKVLIDSAFPAELGGLFKNMESRQNPWGMASKLRLDWAKGLDFDVPVVGSDVESLDEVDYLFWVGCAGAYEDRAKKTSRAVAELLHTAGVSFAILGEGEACTGDSARRAGNEILFQMLAAQNIETLNEAGAKKIVVTCAHCFNTIRNEYPQAGGNYEVVHHTQLLNRLVREKKLVPVARPGQASAQDVASTAPSVTYHDPCYLGRHNNVYAPPRELLGALPGVQLKEMPRSGEKSFCCGAGGARMWMEEKLGTRINEDRTAEAVGTGADRIAIGCPFCRVMLSDGLTAAQASGKARAEVEVVDVAQMLLAAVRAPEGAPPVEAGSAAPEVAGGSAATAALPVDRAEVSVPGGGLNSNAEVDHIPQPAPSASERAEARADTPQPSGAGSTAAHASDAVTAMRAHTPETEEAPAASEEAGAGSSQAVSASDALAAMRAQAAGGEDPGSVTPSGGGSTAAHASDAVTAMRAHSPEPDGASTGAPPAGGPVSASDALAAMRAQQAGQGTSAPSTVSDPAADAASDAAPSGKEPAATVAADKPAPE
ncbi:putative iron-sulfur binding reductase, partial [Kineosphaera limosa NBRC 100340]